MMKRTLEKLEDLRTSLMKEIVSCSLKLQALDIESELPDTISLDFPKDIYEFYPSLENYPFLKFDYDGTSLIYVDKEYREEYINAYKMGEMEIKKECLDVFTVDELYTVCNYLSELENANASD
ncbi:MAG: hypothetical protein IJ630_10985 [Treponema sp.]|nr:hypothetical protein [Treponema sp.]